MRMNTPMYRVLCGGTSALFDRSQQKNIFANNVREAFLLLLLVPPTAFPSARYPVRLP